ncbi:MAG: hypothetical protein HWE24_06020 [Oceanospirillaceae bacterium]|nr:hypothetical protein [Oceanospirillaceae bacterium]
MYRAVAIGVAILFALFTALIYSAVNLPKFNGKITLVDDQLNFQSHPSNDSIPILYFQAGDQQVLANSRLVMEEPDVLPSYASMDALFDQHRLLYQAGQNNQLWVVDALNRKTAIIFEPRTLADLPWLFWLQALCALSAAILCLLVWLPSQKTLSIITFCGTGIGYILAAASAALYSTRDVFISGEWFALLSRINGLGTISFVTLLALFLWHFPNQKPRKWVIASIVVMFISHLMIHIGKLAPSAAEGMYSWIMVIFIFGLVGSGVQWHKTQQRPADRVMLTWVLLSILSGTLFFTAGMIVPVLLGTAEASDQALLLATFLFMYAGIMFAVIRFRLFEIQRWSMEIWSWLLGGIAVLACDFLLISILPLNATNSLAISLAMVGWFYFPVRQWVWNRLFRRRQEGLDHWLSETLSQLLKGDGKVSNVQLINAMEAVFQPLSYTLEHTLSDTRLSSNGEQLWVALPEGQTLLLQHPNKGRRIFNRHDIESVNLILALYSLITDIESAKQEGIMTERHRIRRDLHDDLGAKLLRLLHQSSGESRTLVREAIQDLRSLLNGRHHLAINSTIAAKHWRQLAQSRCDECGIRLHWHDVLTPVSLESDQNEHLGQILQECLSNALRHPATQWIKVQVMSSPTGLNLTIENNCQELSSVVPSGFGIANIHERAGILRGRAQVSHKAGIWRVCVDVPVLPSPLS